MTQPRNTIGIGIDVGMTFSGIGIATLQSRYAQPQPIPIKGQTTNTKIPTRVQFSLIADPPRIGTDVFDPHVGPIYTLFKRRLAEQWYDDQLHRGVSGIELTTIMLRALRQQIESFLLSTPWLQYNAQTQVYYAFAHPASWAGREIRLFNQAIQDAGFNAGSAEYGLIDEASATAACAARLPLVGAPLGAGKPIFVCDFGGGTVDFAIVHAIANQRENYVRLDAAPGGDPRLGMSNLDKAIALLALDKLALLDDDARHVVQQHLVAGDTLEKTWIRQSLSENSRVALLEECREVKEHLCMYWNPTGWSRPVQLPNRQFVTLTHADMGPLLDAMRDYLRSSIRGYLEDVRLQKGNNMQREGIHYCLISGGGYFLPGIEEVILKELHLSADRLISYDKKNAQTMVQCGAASFALRPNKIRGRRLGFSYGYKYFSTTRPAWYMGDALQVPGRGKYFPICTTMLHKGKDFTYTKEETSHFDTGYISVTLQPLYQDGRQIALEIYCGTDDNPARNTLVETLYFTPASGNDKFLCEFRLTPFGQIEVTVRDEDHPDHSVSCRFDDLPVANDN